MLNKIVLIGNLTRDPELRQTPKGIPVARFTVAVRRAVRGNSECAEGRSDAPTADFIPVVAWRRLAEICGEFLRKGKQVAVEGRIQVRSYVQEGENKTFTEVVADNVQMLGRRLDAPGGDIGVVQRDEVPVSDNLPQEAPF